jgi:hypothetical protein
MIAFLILGLRIVVSPLKTKARLEAEIILLRRQLNVLRRRVSSKPKSGGHRPIGFCLARSPVFLAVERRQDCSTL